MFKNTWVPRAWFTLNTIVALCPPLYWSLDGTIEAVGLPMTLFYFLAVCLSISASIVYAYFCDRHNGEFES